MIFCLWKRKKSSSTNTILHFQVVAPINKLVETVPFDMICYSLDWHPQDHISFVENVGMRALDPSSAVSILYYYKSLVIEKLLYFGGLH